MLLTIEKIKEKLEQGTLPQQYNLVSPVILSSDLLIHLLSLFNNNDKLSDFLLKIAKNHMVFIMMFGSTSIGMGSIAQFIYVYCQDEKFSNELSEEKKQFIEHWLKMQELDKEALNYLITRLNIDNACDILFSFNYKRQDLITFVNNPQNIKELSPLKTKLLYHYLYPFRKWEISETPFLDMLYFAYRFGHTLGLSKPIRTKLRGQMATFKTEYGVPEVSMKILVEHLDAYCQRIRSPIWDEISHAMKKSWQLMEFFSPYYKNEAAAIFLKEYLNNELIIVLSGWYRHTLALAFYGNYLVVCNRGEQGSRWYGCKIYEIKNKHLIDEAFLQKLMDYSKNPKEFFDLLKMIVNLKEVVVRFRSKGQKHNNCSFANPKSITEGLLPLIQAGPLTSKENLKFFCKVEMFRRKYKHFSNYIRHREIDELIKNMFYAQDSDLILFFVSLTKEIIMAHHGQGAYFIKNKKEIFRAVDLYNRLPEKILLHLRGDGSFMMLVGELIAKEKKLRGEDVLAEPACIYVQGYRSYMRYKVEVDQKGYICAIDNKNTPKQVYSFHNARKLIAATC